MSLNANTFAELDRLNGAPALGDRQEEEMPLPAWYRSVYRTPLELLSIEDLCKAARQQIHSECVVPLIVARLKKEPLAGEMFDGELLASLRSIAPDYWDSHSRDSDAIKAIIDSAWHELPADVQADANELVRMLEPGRRDHRTTFNK